MGTDLTATNRSGSTSAPELFEYMSAGPLRFLEVAPAFAIRCFLVVLAGEAVTSVSVLDCARSSAISRNRSSKCLPEHSKERSDTAQLEYRVYLSVSAGESSGFVSSLRSSKGWSRKRS